MLVFRAENNKMLDRIANREELDETASYGSASFWQESSIPSFRTFTEHKQAFS